MSALVLAITAWLGRAGWLCYWHGHKDEVYLSLRSGQPGPPHMTARCRVCGACRVSVF